MRGDKTRDLIKGKFQRALLYHGEEYLKARAEDGTIHRLRGIGEQTAERFYQHFGIENPNKPKVKELTELEVFAAGFQYGMMHGWGLPPERRDEDPCFGMLLGDRTKYWFDLYKSKLK